ncbi:MAG: hypothetical protein HZA91_03990 [Verrucomicrobia bacterium]|nr:hypothetical protein [Verrucomicrobiota bacterium]
MNNFGRRARPRTFLNAPAGGSVIARRLEDDAPGLVFLVARPANIVAMNGMALMLLALRASKRTVPTGEAQ